MHLGSIAPIPPAGRNLTKVFYMNAAVAAARGCPVLKGGARITVYETFKAMGM